MNIVTIEHPDSSLPVNALCNQNHGQHCGIECLALVELHRAFDLAQPA